MKNEDLCDLIFRKNFTFGRRTSKFSKENPKIAPPQEKKEKKNIYPKHLKCSLTRAKDKSILTNVGYLMPNPLHTYILNTYDLV